MLSKCDSTVALNWIYRSIPRQTIAELLGCTIEDLRKIEHRQRHFFAPLPHEIQQRAASIRIAWTDAELERRAGSLLQNYKIPEVSCSATNLAFALQSFP